MNSKKAYIILFLIICNLIPIMQYAAGTTSAQFLKIPIGSRMVGMGEAYTSLADDPFALFGNVAGISKQQDLEISISHVEWFGDVDYDFLGFTKSFFNGFGGYPGTLGFAVNYLHMPFFNSYDDWGEIKGQANFKNYALTAGYSQNVMDHLKAGMSFRYISAIYNVHNEITSDHGATVNMGLLYTYRVPGFELFGQKIIGRILDMGFVAENIGLGADFSGFAPEPVYKLGASFNLVEPLITSVDLHLPSENDLRLNTGAELALLDNQLYLRAGYRFLGYNADTYTTGIGTKLKIKDKLIKLDVSYAPMSSLDDVVNITLSIQYPGAIPDDIRKLADTLYYKGIYFYVSGNYDDAIRLWEEALRIYPEFQKAKDKIKEAKELKDLEKIEDATPQKYKPKK